MCVRGLFIAECGNRCVRGDSLLLESVLLTSVHILYRHQYYNTFVAYYTCMFVKSDGPEVPLGILTG